MSRVSPQTDRDLKNAQRGLWTFLDKLETVPYEILLEESQRMNAEIKLETPVDTGKLRNSAKSRVTKTKGKVNLSASASATNPKGYDYAKIQHDTLSYNHPNGGKAFYIRDPFVRGVARIKRRMKEELKLD